MLTIIMGKFMFTMNVAICAVLTPLGMFCFAQKVLECYRRGLMCYEINVAICNC